jgi:hypothetical protein
MYSDPYHPDKQLLRRIAAKEKEWVRVHDDGMSYMVFVPAGYCWVETEKKKEYAETDRRRSSSSQGRGQGEGEHKEEDEEDEEEEEADSATFGPVRSCNK